MPECDQQPAVDAGDRTESQEISMSKRGRKRRSRKKSGANHGNRPNA